MHEGFREKSPSLHLLQGSLCPSFVSSERNGTGIREESSSEPSPVRQPLELTLPTVEENENNTTRSEAAVSPSVLQLEHVLSIEESKFPELVFALGRKHQ